MDGPTPPAAGGPEEWPKLPALAVGWVFLQLGAMAFGGQGAAVALMQRELVERRGWLTKADIMEALTYSLLLPGPTMFEVAAYLGYKLGGWVGTLVAAVAFVTPAMVAITTLSALYAAAAALPGLGLALNGLTAATSGIIAVTALRLSKGSITSPLTLGLAIAAGAGGTVFHLNTALTVIAAGLMGALVLAPTSSPKERGE